MPSDHWNYSHNKGSHVQHGKVHVSKENVNKITQTIARHCFTNMIVCSSGCFRSSMLVATQALARVTVESSCCNDGALGDLVYRVNENRCTII